MAWAAVLIVFLTHQARHTTSTASLLSKHASIHTSTAAVLPVDHGSILFKSADNGERSVLHFFVTCVVPVPILLSSSCHEI